MRRYLWAAVALASFVAFLALGVWSIESRHRPYEFDTRVVGVDEKGWWVLENGMVLPGTPDGAIHVGTCLHIRNTNARFYDAVDVIDCQR